MHLIQMPEFIHTCYQARLVPFFWGQKGVGKSDVVWQSAKFIGERIGDTKFGLVDLRLGTQETGDLVGIPRVQKVTLENGVEEFRTVWGKPEWWPIEGTNGIIFLDEFNRAGTNDVIQAMFQFVLGYKKPDGTRGRRLHTHELPSGWSVICAGNPDTADYVVQSIDTAMLDRFIQIKIDVQKKVSVKWMKDNLQNKEIWKFVQATGNSLGKNENFQLSTTPSPRSYEMVDDLLKYMDEKQFNNYGLEAVTGLLGEELGMILYQHLKESLLRPIPAKDVMDCKDFDKFVKETVSKYLSKDTNHFELIEITLTELLGEIEKKALTEEQATNISNFLDLLPPDLHLKFIREGVVHGENFLPIILTHIATEKNGKTLELIESMGYEHQEILNAVNQIDGLMSQVKKELAKEKEDKANEQKVRKTVK